MPKHRRTVVAVAQVTCIAPSPPTSTIAKPEPKKAFALQPSIEMAHIAVLSSQWTRPGTHSLIAQGQALAQARCLEDVITRAQSEFIGTDDRCGAFEGLLKDFLALTQSGYGFIGEILRALEGAPYLKTYAITNIAWDTDTRSFYEREAPLGMEFTNLETLFGAALSSGEPVIANDPAADPRRGGLPPGHPSLDAFLGVPVHHGGKMVAMFGLANRPGGYDQALIDFLQPLTATLGQLVAPARTRDLHIATERRLRSIIDGTRIGTWEWDVQTGATTFNERWAEIVGYTLDELAPVSIETWGSLAHPDDQQGSNDLLDRHFRGEMDYYDYQCRMRHKDGHWVWVHDRGRVVTWTADGRPLLMSGTHADITAQKAAQIELEASQARLQGLLDLSPGPGPERLRDGGLPRGQRRAAGLDRLQPRGVPAPQLLGCYAKRVRAGGTAATASHGEHGPAHPVREGIRPQGRHLLNGLTMYDTRGRKLIWSIIQDISEHQAFLHHAQMQRDSLHSLLDQLEIGTLLLEPDGRISFASRYCSTMRLKPRVAEDRHWSEILPLRQDEKVQLDQALRSVTREPRQMELSWSAAGRDSSWNARFARFPRRR